MVRILHVDDHIMFTQGMELLFNNDHQSEYSIICTCHDGREVVGQISKHLVDLVLLDLNIPHIDGLELVPEIRYTFPKIRIVILCEYNDPKFVRKTLKSGADGYILKSRSIEDLIIALDMVMDGQVFIDRDLSVVSNRKSKEIEKFEDAFVLRYHLTPRELEILNLISEAKTNKNIGEQLFISDQTVSVHRKNLMRKLGVTNTASLIKKALRHHLSI